MRVLISTTANEGHFGPLVGLANALRSAGHEVRVAAPASYAAGVERAGLPHAPFDDPEPDVVGSVMGRLPFLPPEEADATVVREVFARIDAQAAIPALRSVIEAWGPDVVVREPAEFGSLAAAVAAGVPHVHLAIGMAEMSRLLIGLTDEPLRELARLLDLPETALITAAAAEPILTSVPDSLDRASDPDLDEHRVAIRFREDAPGPGEPLPAWGDPELPLVYVTFGSVTGSLPPFAGVFREALDGLADLPVRVLMTVGRRFDVGGLGPIPANARVEPWWPQASVLPYASVVLSHGGFGTVMGAAAAGVPQVVAPIFTSDQRANARHIAAFGAGRGVAPGSDVVVRACADVAAVLDDPGYHARAADLARDIETLAPVADVVSVVERVARSTTLTAP